MYGSLSARILIEFKCLAILILDLKSSFKYMAALALNMKIMNNVWMLSRISVSKYALIQWRKTIVSKKHEWLINEYLCNYYTSILLILIVLNINSNLSCTYTTATLSTKQCFDLGPWQICFYLSPFLYSKLFSGLLFYI